ncbi:hybrid-cluster protein [Scenedesmus sp. NREL 46B-D3]|nr:hybrid-cluster protein [Scenedesmus sp. NREL 46B-D3]
MALQGALNATAPALFAAGQHLARLGASGSVLRCSRTGSSSSGLMTRGISSASLELKKNWSSVKAKPGLRSFAAQPALDETAMFCFQCEQTQDNKGCTTVGVCGKTPEVAGLQDLLIFSLKGLGGWAHLATQHGVDVPQEIQSFITGATFSTLTNVNFDEARFLTMLEQAEEYEAYLRAALQARGGAAPKLSTSAELGWTGELPHPMAYQYPGSGNMELLRHQAKQAGVALRRESLGATLAGLQEMLVYGLKGMAAYTHHAEALGSTDPAAYACINEVYAFLGSPAAKDPAAVLGMCMKLGGANFGVMKMLSEGHSRRLCDARTGVSCCWRDTWNSVGVRAKAGAGRVVRELLAGKCILVTGHDMHDLDTLLQQTEGKGINVYTHGEMLPAHGYPGLKKYKHLVGHFGGAWYRQKADFSAFPGAVLATTNCVLDPPKAYKDRLFTTNEELAQERTEEGRLGTVTVGFGHDAVLGVAGDVVDAVQSGKLEHIFVIGGCDGSEPQRKYYDRLARLCLPTPWCSPWAAVAVCFILTWTRVCICCCTTAGKFRIFDQDFGMLPGTSLPRLLDMGQCNDAYSALVVAMELAKVFKTDVNGLPLSLDISWFEQKAVAVLLTMLHLGVKNIRLGPRLPAFLTPDAVKQLVDAFAIKPANTEDPAHDLKQMMANH